LLLRRKAGAAAPDLEHCFNRIETGL